MIQFLITGANGFIGTNLVTEMRSRFPEPFHLLLLDIVPPKIELNQNEKWLKANILNKEEIEAIFREYQPQIVIHLAAITSTDPVLKLKDYEINSTGSKYVFEACEKYGIKFLVHTSTQFVNQSDSIPSNDTDFAPHTVYGESKVISEQMLRSGNYSFNWCIIRPTNIWGPWHIRYPSEFWRILKEGKYFHPGKKKVMRSYGYVGNICWQILELIKKREEKAISRNVFYVGDHPVNMYDWANAFSFAITGKGVRVVPSFVVYGLAITGSVLQKIGIRFPITLSRYKSMTTDNPAPMENTFSTLGSPPYTMEEGVKITTEWLWDFWKMN